jgi:predicted dehydrogenase
MDNIKTAVIGVGALGRHHLRWYTQLEGSEVIGIYDIDRAKAEQYAREYNITAFESLEETAAAVDAVSIAVPTTSHFEVASEIIERGVHCLIEKPITANTIEAEKLKRLAEQSGVTVTVGQIERFNPAVQALKDMAVTPSFIEAHRLAAFNPRGTDVAVVLDLMIHDIDLVLMLVKSTVVDLQASAVAVVSEEEDIANARLTFDNGAVANLTASRISLHAMRKLRIFQPFGYYSLDLAAKQADIYRLVEPGEDGDGMRMPLGQSGRELLYSKRPDSGQDMLGAELEAFLKAVRGKQPVAVSLGEAVEALRIAREVERIGAEAAERLKGSHAIS